MNSFLLITQSFYQIIRFGYRAWLGFILVISGLFGLGCYPHKEIMSHELRPLGDFPKEPLQMKDEDLAAHTPKEFVSETLQNGMKVSILSDWRSPTIAIQMSYRIEAGQQGHNSFELAHLIEHMMRSSATKNYKQYEYDEHIHRHGGENGAVTLPDQTIYQVEITPEYHEKVLQMEADRMVNLLLTEEGLRAQKNVVGEELRFRYENNPIIQEGIHIFDKMMNGHPYANYFAGTSETVKAVKLSQVKTFYQMYYGPQNVHLVIVGPVDVKQELEKVKHYFSQLSPSQGKPQEVPRLLDWPFPKEGEFSQKVVPAKIAMILYPLPPLSERDIPALNLLGQMLCSGKSSEGMCQDHNNFLYADLVKQKKVAVEAGVSLLFQKAGGAMYFYAAYLPYRRKPTAFQFLEESLKQLAQFDWLTEDRLSIAKRVLLKSLYGATYLPADRAALIQDAETNHGDARYAFEQTDVINAVTKIDIERVFKRYLTQQVPVKLYMPPEKVPGWLTLFGWFYPVVTK